MPVGYYTNRFVTRLVTSADIIGMLNVGLPARDNLVDSWSGNVRVERLWEEKKTVMSVWNCMRLLGGGGGLVVVPNGNVSYGGEPWCCCCCCWWWWWW